LFSRIQAKGICRGPEPGREGCVGDWLAVPALDQIEVLEQNTRTCPWLVSSNLAQLSQVETNGLSAPVPVHLTGLVREANPAQCLLAFEDGSRAALIEMDFPPESVRPGNRILLEGYAKLEGARVRLRNPVLVDNDALHTAQEKKGSIFLTPGKHAIRVSWFNRDDPYALEVWFEGPSLPRQKIPDAALFHRTSPAAGAPGVWLPGLEYRCYEGAWLRVPNTTLLGPVKQGTTANFDARVAGKTAGIAIDFEGFVEVLQEGLYTFSTISDDGSLLTIDEQPPRLEVIGAGALTEPLHLKAGQPIDQDRMNVWAEVEGTVSFASTGAGGLELELSSGTGRMRVEAVDGSGCIPALLLHGRVKATGICQSAWALDGQITAGVLVTPSAKQIEILEAASSALVPGPTNEVAPSLPLLTKVEQVKRLSRTEAQRGYPVKIRGVVTTVLDSGFFIQDSTWSIYARWRPTAEVLPPR